MIGTQQNKAKQHCLRMTSELLYELYQTIVINMQLPVTLDNAVV